VPEVNNVWPEHLVIGSQSFEMVVVGSGFVTQTTVTWNGQNLVTSYLNPTHLLAAVPAANVNTAFNAQIKVVNPTPGGGTSASQTAVSGYSPILDDTKADSILGQPDFDVQNY
jgi:hypothetical protein